jgi:Ser-tRNA(Ala) deacylase AlaX
MDKVIPSKENDYGGLFDREEFAQVLKVFGNKEFAFEIIHKVAEDSMRSLDVLKEDIEKEDYADYAIKAHGIKGMMASVYYEPLRVRSLNHEMAAKEGRYDFIREDYEDYSRECREFCSSVLG